MTDILAPHTVDATNLPKPGRLTFAGFVLDLHAGTLRAPDGEAIELRPQAYAVLEQLARRAGGLVTKAELMEAVWPRVVVTDDSLVQAVGDLRHALGEAGRDAVRTVPRRGYMLVGAELATDVKRTEPLGQRRRPSRLTSWIVGLAAAALLFTALAWHLLPSAPLPARSIAVLPFHGAQPGRAVDDLARAVAGSLIEELARSPDLIVISSQSSFRFDTADVSLPEIARRLRARYLVDGNVEREGEKLRMRVDLIDGGDGHLLWTRTEQADRASIGAVQQSFVARIAGSLQSRVAGAEQRRAATAPRSLDVVALTARAAALIQRYSAGDLDRARALLRQALELDPDYAPAWVYLGLANVSDIGLQLTGKWDRKRLPEALAQIQRGLARQPDLPVGWVALSQAQGIARDYVAALDAARRCVALSPNDGACLYALGSAELRLGQSEPAVMHLSEAMDRNPLPPPHFSAFYGTALWSAGRFTDALQVADACLAVAPEFWRCRQDRVASLVALGRLDEARAEAARLHAMLPTMTAQWFGAGFSPDAAALAKRRVAAAVAAGMVAR